jgi:hypothetical protein
VLFSLILQQKSDSQEFVSQFLSQTNSILKRRMSTTPLPSLYRRSLPSPPAIEFASPEGKVRISLSLSLSLKLNAFCLSVCECFVAVEAVCGGVRRWNNGGVFQADIVLPNAVGACVLRASHPRRGPQCARHRSRKKMERYLRFLLTNSAQLFYLFIYFLSLTFNKIQKYKQK